jgi:hypothetical protein
VSAPAALAAFRRELADAVCRVDVDAVRETYRRQNEFVHLERWLPPAAVAPMVDEVNRVRPAIHRSYIPRHKKGGSVSFYTLLAEAPTILALYRDPGFLAFVAGVTGQRVMPCPDQDPHACALYFYTEPGDHIGFHFDTSYYRGTRYTLLLGLIERSSSRLVGQPFKGEPDREPVEVRIATEPGTLVLFNGNTLWHAITPLGEGEERVSLTMEYVTDPSMSPIRRFVSSMKDSIAYFGFRTVLGGAPARRREG